MLNHSFTQNIGTRVHVSENSRTQTFEVYRLSSGNRSGHTKKQLFLHENILLKNSFTSPLLTVESCHRGLPSQWTSSACARKPLTNVQQRLFKSPKIIPGCLFFPHSEIFWKFVLKMSDAGETEYLYLGCYCVKLAPLDSTSHTQKTKRDQSQ